MRIMASLVIAFATYSRIPVPRVDWTEENRRYCLCFFPMIGLVIGLALYVWMWGCVALGVGDMLRGCVGAIIPLLVTGGIHMDGFMDTCDALASWQTKERRLEILKDSHVGAFAVIGCCAYLTAMAGVLGEASITDAPLIGMGFVASRALSAATSATFKGARENGMLSSMTRTASRRAALLCAGLYAALCLYVWSLAGAVMTGLCALTICICALAYRRMAYRQFGGVTGDLAGWLLQAVELALAAVIVMGGKIL